MIIGGVAILFQGRFRTTEDIDVVIVHERMDIESFVTFCEEHSLSIAKYELEEGFKEQSHVSIFDLPNNIRIDLMGTYTSWDRIIVEEAETFLYDKTPIKIAKPEHLIINKLNKGGRLDLEDAFSVYFQNQKRIDGQMLERLAKLRDIKDQLRDFIVRITELEKDSESYKEKD